MITVKYLKRVLDDIDDDALVYAYEGEVIGIIILRSQNPNIFQEPPVAVIKASEDDSIEDEWERYAEKE